MPYVRSMQTIYTSALLTITLSDGATLRRTVTRMPTNWKSWLMRQLPYGTDFQGATFTRQGQS